MIGTKELSNYIKKNCLLIIDSNIFFKPYYEPFLIDIFKRISSFKGFIEVYDIQVDEIKNISLERDSKRSFGARNALRFIEKMVDDGAVKIIDSKKPKGFHVDELILQKFKEEENKDKMKILISDDRELRIKIKAFNKKEDTICVEGTSVFVSPEDLYSAKGVASLVGAGTVAAGAALVGIASFVFKIRD